VFAFGKYVIPTSATVLVFDDRRSFYSALWEHLPLEGFKLDQVRTEQDFWAYLERQRPDLLMISALQQNVDALSVCRKVKDHLPSIEVFLLIDRTRLFLRKKIFEHGADDYFLLPPMMEEVAARIQVRLALRRLLSTQQDRQPAGADRSESQPQQAPEPEPQPGPAPAPDLVPEPDPDQAHQRPDAPPPAEPPPAPAARRKHAGTVEILIADDDGYICQLLRHYCEKEGWTVTTAEDGEQAEHLIRENEYDFILLDNYMPYRSGFDLLQWMQETDRRGGTRVVMLSAQGREESIIEAFSLGADDFIAKPFSPSLVVSRLNRFLDQGK
jgi:DNA-binding response OmpR family regulator